MLSAKALALLADLRSEVFSPSRRIWEPAKALGRHLAWSIVKSEWRETAHWQVLRMDRLLDRLLRQIVRAGNLTLSDAQGTPHRYGDGAGFAVQARIADQWLEWRLLLDPYLALGGGYMDGRLRMERGRICDLLALLARDIERQPPPPWTAGFDGLRFILRRVLQFNPARRNAAHH